MMMFCVGCSTAPEAHVEPIIILEPTIPPLCVEHARLAAAEYPDCARLLFEESHGTCEAAFGNPFEMGAVGARGYCAHLEMLAHPQER